MRQPGGLNGFALCAPKANMTPTGRPRRRPLGALGLRLARDLAGTKRTSVPLPGGCRITKGISFEALQPYRPSKPNDMIVV